MGSFSSKQRQEHKEATTLLRERRELHKIRLRFNTMSLEEKCTFMLSEECPPFLLRNLAEQEDMTEAEVVQWLENGRILTRLLVEVRRSGDV